MLTRNASRLHSASTTPHDRRATALKDAGDAGPPSSRRSGAEEEDHLYEPRPTPSHDECDASTAGLRRHGTEDPERASRPTKPPDYRDASTPSSQRPGTEDPATTMRIQTTASLDVRDADFSDGRCPEIEVPG